MTNFPSFYEKNLHFTAHLIFQQLREVLGLHKPKDTFVVCGLNDVQNTTPDRFKAVLQALHYDVMSANENNTFRVCKLLRPPKLAWCEASGDPPTSTYINYLGRINDYNIIIDEFNESNWFERVIGFHLEGRQKEEGPRGSARCSALFQRLEGGETGRGALLAP